MTNIPLKQSSDIVKEKQAWLAIWCFILMIALPLAVGLGQPVIYIFPAGAFALGLFLYIRTPHLYIGYTWWMIFIGNLVRRLIDYHSGYLTPGPWGFSAVLVSAISSISLLRYLPTAHRGGGIPFVLAFSSIGYAFCVGFNNNHPLNALVNGFLDWVCPVTFSFYIFNQWRDYPKIKNIFLKTFLWGVVVMGVYGVVQYVFAPPWEQFFLNNTSAISFGKPEPFSIRIFSTSGSPQAFAAIMLTGLIVLFCEATNPVSYVASGFGYISLILSMARAVWLSAAISIPLFLLSLKPSHQIRMIVVVIVIFLIVTAALLSWEPVYEKFYERFESFLDLEDDNSLNARTAGYQVLWGIAITQFSGQGIGFSTSQFNIALGANDGSLFPLLFTFGWLGLVFYLGGFTMLFTKLLQLPDAHSDVFISACRMVVICVLVQSGLNSVFGGGLGMVIWGFSAIGLAGHKYYRFQEHTSANQSPLVLANKI